MVNDIRFYSNNLCRFNIFWSTYLKKKIAYSSVSHMDFITLGIGSTSDIGLNGTVLQIISHGFIGIALFNN